MITKNGGCSHPYSTPINLPNPDGNTGDCLTPLLGLGLTDAIEIIERAGFCDRASQLLILDVLGGAA